MLSREFIRNDPELVKKAVALRGDTAPIDEIVALDRGPLADVLQHALIRELADGVAEVDQEPGLLGHKVGSVYPERTRRAGGPPDPVGGGSGWFINTK